MDSDVRINLSGMDDKTKVSSACRRSDVTGECLSSRQKPESTQSATPSTAPGEAKQLPEKSEAAKKDAGLDAVKDQTAVILINGVPIKIPIGNLVKNLKNAVT